MDMITPAVPLGYMAIACFSSSKMRPFMSTACEPAGQPAQELMKMKTLKMKARGQRRQSADRKRNRLFITAHCSHFDTTSICCWGIEKCTRKTEEQTGVSVCEKSVIGVSRPKSWFCLKKSAKRILVFGWHITCEDGTASVPTTRRETIFNVKLDRP